MGLATAMAAAAMWLAGCASDSLDGYFRDIDPRASVFVAPSPPRVEKVALMPFKAPTELIGTSVSDMFVTELLRIGRFHLVERSQMANVLNESELALAGLSESKAAEIGTMLGADAVIIGTVDEYGTSARSGNTIPVVGISVRMIDCKSGRVLCSADLAKRGVDGDVSLGEQARLVVHKITAGLYQKWKRQPQAAAPAADEDRPAQAARVKGADGPGPAPTAAPVATAAAAPSLAPARPAGFKVSDMGLRRATIAWASTAEAAGVRYRIERADERNGTFLPVGEVSASRGEFVDRGSALPLKDSATYYYRIIAVSPAGLESQPTEVLETMTAPPPAPVAGLEGESGLVRVVPLRWKASADPGVIRYVILRGDSPDGPFVEIDSVKAPATIAFTDGGREPGRLKDGATYYYRVRIVNEVGAVSEDSAPVQASTRPPPPAVAGFKAQSLRPREIPLAWEASPDEKVTAYVIARAEGATGPFQDIQTVQGRDKTAWVDRGGERDAAALGRLKDGTLYRYRVAAVNLGDTRSVMCEPVEASTKPAPHKPADVVAGKGAPRKVRVHWAPNPETDIKEYVVEGRPSDGWRFHEVGRISAADGKATETLQEGLEDGKAYVYRVKAVDVERLESEWSDPVEGLTKAVPHAPGTPKAEWKDAGATLTWGIPPESDIKQYRVWRKGLLGLNATPLGTTEAPEFTLQAADIGSKVTVQVSAVDADGLEGPRSDSVDVRPPAPSR